MKLHLVGFIICWIVGYSATVSARNEISDACVEWMGDCTPEELEYVWSATYVSWRPDELILVLTWPSYEQLIDRLDRGLFQEGDLQTGLASLDRLIHRTGVIRFRRISTYGFIVRFAAEEADFDLPSMALLYMQNDHVLGAEPNGGLRLAETSVYGASWGLIKHLNTQRSAK